jgi:hypothetical protein
MPTGDNQPTSPDQTDVTPVGDQFGGDAGSTTDIGGGDNQAKTGTEQDVGEPSAGDGFGSGAGATDTSGFEPDDPD